MTALTRPPLIVCAAIRGVSGEVLLGIRHYDQSMLAQLSHRSDAEQFKHRMDDDQGFVDQYSTYYTRAQAYVIAKKRYQIRNEACCSMNNGAWELYSEALY